MKWGQFFYIYEHLYLPSVHYSVFKCNFVFICLTLKSCRFQNKLFEQLSFNRCSFWIRQEILSSESNSMFS